MTTNEPKITEIENELEDLKPKLDLEKKLISSKKTSSSSH